MPLWPPAPSALNLAATPRSLARYCCCNQHRVEKSFWFFFFLPQSQKVTVSASSVISIHSHSICSEEEAHPSLHPGRWLLVGRLEESRCRHHRHHQGSMVRDQVAARVRAEKDRGRKQSVRLEKTHLSQQLDDSTFNL